MSVPIKMIQNFDHFNNLGIKLSFRLSGICPVGQGLDRAARISISLPAELCM